MRWHRIIINGVLAVAGLAAAAPAPIDAQEVVVRVAPNRGMLGFMTRQHIATNGQVQAVILDVVKDSPADRAGVLAGDTIVRVNGLQPTQQVLTGIQAGDTVTARLRRNGVERDVRVVAAPRNDEYRTMYTLPDSVRNAVAILVDRVRADLDTINFPRIHVQRMHGDSTIVFFGGDRVMTMREPSFSMDSVRTMMLSRAGELRFFADSMLRAAWPDSMMRRTFRIFDDSTRFNFFADSVGFQFRGAFPEGRVFEFRADTAFGWGARPGELMRSGMVIGMRAVAGAELSELNPALGEYFGTIEGVLVLNAPEGTPAARAGLQPGDVITRANGEAVRSIGDLRRIVDRARPGSTVRLNVLRRGTRFDVELNRL